MLKPLLIGGGLLTVLLFVIAMANKGERRKFALVAVAFGAIVTLAGAFWTFVSGIPEGVLWTVLIVAVLIGLVVTFTTRLGLAILGTVAVAAMLFLPATIANAGSFIPASPGGTEAPAGDTAPANDATLGEPDPAAMAAIGSPPSYDCMALVDKYGLPAKNGVVTLSYITNDVDKGDETKRAFSDAVNIPLKPTEIERFYASVFSQPEMTGMIGVALANDAKLADVNPGVLKQFVGMTPKEWADDVFNGVISPSEAATTGCDLVSILSTLQPGGPETATTSYRAQEARTSLEGDVRPITLNEKQYEGEFLTLSITRKGQEGCWLKLGVNTKDQRIAGLECEKPKPKPKEYCTASDGKQYELGSKQCTTAPPETKFCVAPDGSKHPVGDPKCNTPEKKYCTASNGKQYPEGDARCNPTEEKWCVAPDGKKYPEGDARCNPPKEVCKWDPKLPPNDPKCLEPKEKENNTEEPDGVDKQEQTDDVEKEQPKEEDPIDTTEKPGTDPGTDTTVDNNENSTPPTEDPVEDPQVEPQPEDPGTTSQDPDQQMTPVTPEPRETAAPTPEKPVDQSPVDQQPATEPAEEAPTLSPERVDGSEVAASFMLLPLLGALVPFKRRKR
jgi:hypothetical protein